MESNMSTEQRNKVSARAQELAEEKTKIDLMALTELKSILKTCKDNRLSFADTGDADEDFVITMPDIDGTPTVYLVDEIKLDHDTVYVVDETGREWQIWEIGEPVTSVLTYAADQLLMEEYEETEC